MDPESCLKDEEYVQEIEALEPSQSPAILMRELDTALQKQQDHRVRLLLPLMIQRGYAVLTQVFAHPEYVWLALELGACADQPHLFNKQTIAHKLIRSNMSHTDLITLYHLMPINVAAQDLMGHTPVRHAFSTSMCPWKNPLFVQCLLLLLDHDLEATISSIDEDLVRPELRCVLERAVDLGWNPQNHHVPLIHAALSLEQNRISTFHWLIEHGCEVDQRNEGMQTPLFLVDDQESAQWLLDHGADANTQDALGNTPLLSMVLRSTSSWPVMRLLLPLTDLLLTNVIGINALNLDSAWFSRKDIDLKTWRCHLLEGDKFDKINWMHMMRFSYLNGC